MKLRERANYIMFVMIILVFVYLVISLASKDRAFEEMENISTVWNYEGEEQDLPIRGKPVDGKKYVISRVLPDAGFKGGVLLFQTENMFWSVSVDGKLIDSLSRDDLSDIVLSHTVGDRWNLVSLPDNAGGKVVSITMIPTDAVTAHFIKKVYYSPVNVAIKEMCRKFIPILIMAVAILVFGLFYLALSEVVIYRWKEKRQLTFVGLFAICVSVWASLQSPFSFYVVGESYSLMALGYLALPWLLGFVILSAYCGHKERYSTFGKVMFSLPFIYGIVIVFLDVFGLVSFGNTLVVTQLCALVIAAGALIHAVREIIETKFEMTGSKTIIAVANIMLALSAVTDVLRCMVLETDDYSKCFRVAVMFYMIVIGMDALLTYAEEQNLIEGAGVMRQIAMHDGLTGVFNRMAFNDRIDILPKQPNVGFIHFDVNNLKYANDTYGHSEGDALIKMAAHGIEKSFGNMGECYRYGGDEFTVITEGYDTEKIKECMGNLRIYMALVNHDSDMLRTRLSMACGYAHFSVGEDESLVQTFERADKRMYDNKRGMKELAARLGGGL